MCISPVVSLDFHRPPDNEHAMKNVQIPGSLLCSTAWDRDNIEREGKDETLSHAIYLHAGFCIGVQQHYVEAEALPSMEPSSSL